MTTQQEIDAIIGKYTVQKVSGTGTYYREGTVRAMLTEALAQREAQEPVGRLIGYISESDLEFPFAYPNVGAESEDRCVAVYTTPPTLPAAEQAAELAMQNHCAEIAQEITANTAFQSRDSYKTADAIQKRIRALPLETSALEAFGMKVAREAGDDYYQCGLDEHMRPTDTEVLEIVKRVIEGEKA
jgi:hypothetical protein